MFGSDGDRKHPHGIRRNATGGCAEETLAGGCCGSHGCGDAGLQGAGGAAGGDGETWALKIACEIAVRLSDCFDCWILLVISSESFFFVDRSAHISSFVCKQYA